MVMPIPKLPNSPPIREMTALVARLQSNRGVREKLEKLLPSAPESYCVSFLRQFFDRLSNAFICDNSGGLFEALVNAPVSVFLIEDLSSGISGRVLPAEWSILLLQTAAKLHQHVIAKGETIPLAVRWCALCGEEPENNHFPRHFEKKCTASVKGFVAVAEVLLFWLQELLSVTDFGSV